MDCLEGLGLGLFEVGTLGILPALTLGFHVGALPLFESRSLVSGYRPLHTAWNSELCNERAPSLDL